MPTDVVPGSPADANTADDVVVRRIYDERGRHIADVDPLSRRTDYEYDDDARLIAVTLPAVDVDGSATGTADRRRPRYEYHYDAQGNKTHVVANAYLDEATAQVAYVSKDAGGNSTEVARSVNAAYATWPNDKGNVTVFTYDAEGRQKTRTLPMGAGFVERFEYETAPGAAQGQLKY